MQLDEIKCTLLHKISYFIFARVVNKLKLDCLSMPSVLFISAYLANSKYFALFFASLDIFFVNSVYKNGFTGTCQIFAHIYKHNPQTGKVIRIYQVCTCI